MRFLVLTMFAHIAPAADRRYPRRCLVMHAVVPISLSCPHATSELATVAARILRRDCVLTAGRPRNDHLAAAWRLRGDREVTALAVRKKHGASSQDDCPTPRGSR